MKLTQLQAADWPTVSEWLSDKELIQQIALEPPDLGRPLLIWVIRLNDGSPVGWVELFNVDAINRKADLGMAIPDPKGRGFSLRALRRTVRIAFDELGLHRITMRVLASNRNARALLGRYGLTPEGREKGACFIDGRYEDILVYGVTKE